MKSYSDCDNFSCSYTENLALLYKLFLARCQAQGLSLEHSGPIFSIWRTEDALTFYINNMNGIE